MSKKGSVTTLTNNETLTTTVNRMKMNFSLILTKEELERIHFVTNKNDKKVPAIRIDTHGLRRHEAERMLKNVMNLCPSATIVNVIHGYNGGTVIRDLVRTGLRNNRIQGRYKNKYNKGVTCLKLASAM